MMFLAFCLLNDIADQQLIISAVVVHGCNFLSIEKFAVIESFLNFKPSVLRIGIKKTLSV